MSQMGQKRTSGVHFCNVRFTPKSGHRRVRSPCPFSADITSRPRAVDQKKRPQKEPWKLFYVMSRRCVAREQSALEDVTLPAKAQRRI